MSIRTPIDVAISLAKVRGTAVFAAPDPGGAMARQLAQAFRHVSLFEPEPEKVRRLAIELPEANVTINEAKLGAERRLDARFVTLPLDALRLEHVGLVYLDLDGEEPLVLAGGTSMIAHWRPVVALAERGRAARFGYARQYAANALRAIGYGLAARAAHMAIMVPV